MVYCFYRYISFSSTVTVLEVTFLLYRLKEAKGNVIYHINKQAEARVGTGVLSKYKDALL